MRLLNLVRPRRAYFGAKDHQQYLLIRGMTEAFFMDVEIVACETVREDDGLAMSSRNALLTGASRGLAAKLNRALRSPEPDRAVCESLESLGFSVEYIVARQGRRYGAVTVPGVHGPVRLIDNVEVGSGGANRPRSSSRPQA